MDLSKLFTRSTEERISKRSSCPTCQATRAQRQCELVMVQQTTFSWYVPSPTRQRQETCLPQDIYGELMDCVYLAQKYSKPLSWDSWMAIRQVVDYAVAQAGQKDLSIWYAR